MLNFDFISNAKFRESLETDYVEMSSCVEKECWKAAQVLAGSIVEALLIDYIEAYPNPARRMSRPNALQLDLAEAIEILKTENVISKTSADLCSVIRAYRNLIHPGRVIRTGEKLPNKGSATIAYQLVDVVTNELAQELQKRVGLTAEQIASKIDIDSRSVKVLNHLLVNFNENQRRRLLVDIFPKIYAQETNDDWGDDAKAERIAEAHRVVFEGAAEETKRAFLAEFVRIIKVENGKKVESSMFAFFRAKDLDYAEIGDRALILDILFHTLPKSQVNLTTLRPLEGIYRVISLEKINEILDPLFRTLINTKPHQPLLRKIKNILTDGAWNDNDLISKAVNKRFAFWEAHLKNRGSEEKSKMLEDIREIPF